MHRRAAAGEGGKRKKKTKEKSSASHISIHQVKSRLKNYEESDYSTTLTDCGQTSTATDYRGKMKTSYGYYGGNTEDKVTYTLFPSNFVSLEFSPQGGENWREQI